MNINCPQCDKEYEIDESKIPSTGAQVKCSKCNTMIDIDFPIEDNDVKNTPDWYLTTDGENVYEATNKEVIEWILENRLIRTHKVSKDSQIWNTLEQIPDFLKIIENKEKEEAIIEDEPTIENSKSKEVASSYKKIDYTDYDDNTLESSEDYKSKKSHVFIWLILFIIMGLGIFALIKPKFVKKLFTDFNPTSNVNSEDKYNRAMNLFKSYNLENKDEVISLFNQSLKENPSYEPALINKTLFIAYNLHFEELDFNFRESLSKRLELLSKEKNNEVINKILLNNNRKSLKTKKDIESLKELLFPDLKDKVKALKTTQKHNLIITLALLSYLENNKNGLKKYLLDAISIKKDSSKTSFIKLLRLKINNDKLYLSSLDDLTTKYAESIPLNFLNAFELLKQGKYGESRASFKTIKALSPKNKIATDYILLLNTLIKNKKNLEPKKEEVKKDATEGDKKEEVKKTTDLSKGKAVPSDTKVEKKKVVPKKVVKVSAERATDQGWNMIDKNRLSGAIKKFKYAIAMNPRYALAYQGLGEAYRMRENTELAIKYYKIFLAKDPNNSEAGLVRKQLKKLEASK